MEKNSGENNEQGNSLALLPFYLSMIGAVIFLMSGISEIAYIGLSQSVPTERSVGLFVTMIFGALLARGSWALMLYMRE